MQVESRITEVTLYARGARVRRTASVALTGPRVRITGLPVAALDDTVRVEAEGGAVVTAVHVGLDAPAPEAAAEEVAAELRDARRSAALADAEVERLDAALAALAAAPIAASEPAAPRSEPPPAWGAIVEARRALVALRAERELALRDQAAAARRAAAEAQRALAAAQDRERRAGTARPARLHELRKHIDLQVEGSGSATLYLEYQVAAARWAPSYVARLDGERAVLEVRAAVAQATGEDWTAVRLRLSTAEPEQFGALPELAAQRIGRRQPEPVRAGFRAPPAGVAALYDDYLRAFPSSRGGDARIAGGGRVPPADAPSPGSPAFAPLPSAPAFGAPPSAPAGRAGPPMPAPGAQVKTRVAAVAATQAMRARAAPPEPEPAASLMAAAVGADVIPALGGGDRVMAPPRPPPPPPRLDYTNLRMAPPGSPERGALIPASDRVPGTPVIAAVARPLAALDALALPPGCSVSWPHTYDYAFATDGAVDVRSDGRWHSIAVTARPATAKLRHVAVPREQTDVFRLASIANPLAGPLLPGPVDVYDRGKFLITSAVEHTPPEAAVEIGLGVDPAVKLARNTEFREEAAGMLRGGLRLLHAIAIDVDNRSDRAIDLEVRERLPVTREGDDVVAVIAGRVEPAWERWTPEPDAPGAPRLRGGHRWRVAIPARTRRTLRAAYEVKIAGKHELVGGNRRER